MILIGNSWNKSLESRGKIRRFWKIVALSGKISDIYKMVCGGPKTVAYEIIQN